MNTEPFLEDDGSSQAATQQCPDNAGQQLGARQALEEDPDPEPNFAMPRLRKDWQKEGQFDPLGGRVTSQEGLWGVIVTMGVAAMRDSVMEDHDVMWYILHYYCLMGVVSASVTYATRFNDEDNFHTIFWALFLIGMFYQQVFLYHSMQGFALVTALQYLLVLLANVRVAVCLPRARPFCMYFAASHLWAAAILSMLACFPNQMAGHEKVVLWMHLAVEPIALIGWVILSSTEGTADVPVSIEYMISRQEGFHMMFIVCSFLFPLGLQGMSFHASSSGAAVVIFGNLYALALKLTLLDRNHARDHRSNALSYHAIRRSRPTAVLFLLLLPVMLLGIALSGVGFVAAVKCESSVSLGLGEPDSDDVEFARNMICGGLICTWGIMAITKALHDSPNPVRHKAKVGVLVAGSLSFVIPILVECSPYNTAAVCTGLAAATGRGESVRSNPSWWCKAPREVKDWHSVDSGETMHSASATSAEHLFTVLVAVGVFALNEAVGKDEDIGLYILRNGTLHSVVYATMVYASRFSDDDLAHKILWGLFQVGLLLTLEGLTAGDAAADKWSLYKVTNLALYGLLAIGFFGRVALGVPRARAFATVQSVFYSILGVLMLGCCLTDGVGKAFVWVLVGLSFSFDALLVAGSSLLSEDMAKQLDVPLAIEYIIPRFNGLIIEVLGVAVIVPTAVYPHAAGFSHTSHVAAAEVLAVLLALALKAVVFDVEPRSVKCHAISKSRWHAVSFLSLFPLTMFGVCSSGAALAKLVTNSGNDGPDAKSHFFQRLLFAGCAITCGSLTLVKFLHTPSVGVAWRHQKKLILQSIVTLVLALLAIIDPGSLSDLGAVATASGMILFTAGSQICLNMIGN